MKWMFFSEKNDRKWSLILHQFIFALILFKVAFGNFIFSVIDLLELQLIHNFYKRNILFHNNIHMY